MATLAQINDTLRDQTSSIEDGTRTTAGLKDRFGEFLDRQQGGGDRREEELESKQKEREQKFKAQRPSSFTAGLKQGLGLPSGFGIGAIAEKLMGAMGLAAGTIGLGAGKLLRFAPAIAVMSKFGEQAIGGLVDYIDDEILKTDFTEETKKRLTQGGQAAIATKLLGAKGLFGPAIAGVIGAYGETGIKKFNEFFGKEDGKYNIPLTDIQIDTETAAFRDGLAIAAGIAAPGFLKFLGRGLLFFLGKVGAGRAAVAMGAAVAGMLGLKNPFAASNVGPALDEIKKNAPKPPPPKVRPGGFGPLVQMMKSDPRMTLPANTNAPVAPETKESRLKKAQNLIRSVKGFDKAISTLGKLALPFGVAIESVLAQGDPRLNMVQGRGTKAAVGVLTSPLGLVDMLQNAFAGALNLPNAIANFGMSQIYGEDAPQLSPIMGYSDFQGAAREAINQVHGGLVYTSKTPTEMMIDAIPPDSIPDANRFNSSGMGPLVIAPSHTENNMGGVMQVITMPSPVDAVTLIQVD
tara:strand:+ start:111 stop:1670 length:1560 start_codon:yes stop_codon:yes gene_type:complete